MAQQYRNTGHPGPTFLKSGVQHQSDHGSSSNGRAQLKSPSSSQPDVLSSVFSELISRALGEQSSEQILERTVTDDAAV
ncbi:unnamed protein product [Timema podura]|uniref:Uncharacterized protein n=1 Tax=Timema podura TaxID=61482 RepID=A0ABN7NPF1_TIMPD|nr:unnamed protein product [Timema podura]